MINMPLKIVKVAWISYITKAPSYFPRYILTSKIELWLLSTLIKPMCVHFRGFILFVIFSLSVNHPVGSVFRRCSRDKAKGNI